MYKALFLVLFLMTAAAFGEEYKMEPAGEPPAEVSAGIRQALQKEGAKILASDGSPVMEVWLRNEMPSGPKSAEPAVTFPETPESVLLGVARYYKDGGDRLGQIIKPGVYTLRYSRYPVDGAHQGVAPQRDFLILVRADDDQNLETNPSYKELMKLSAKAMGTSHPGSLSIWKEEKYFTPGFAKEGEHDWVWMTKIGSTQLAFILIGKGDH
jgi:hypothetical protein